MAPRILELVTKLNVSTKWCHLEKPILVGDVFVVLDENTPRACWPLDLATATYPGSDGVVRTVDIRIAGKVYGQAVHRLVPLEVQEAATLSPSHLQQRLTSVTLFKE